MQKPPFRLAMVDYAEAEERVLAHMTIDNMAAAFVASMFGSCALIETGNRRFFETNADNTWGQFIEDVYASLGQFTREEAPQWVAPEGVSLAKYDPRVESLKTLMEFGRAFSIEGMHDIKGAQLAAAYAPVKTGNRKQRRSRNHG